MGKLVCGGEGNGIVGKVDIYICLAREGDVDARGVRVGDFKSRYPFNSPYCSGIL